MKCFSCGAEMVFSHAPGRRDECPRCGADVHACRNCQHYDRSAYNECREPAADVVREKDRSNFCDYFQPAAAGGRTEADRQKDLRAAAEALFKKKS
jgi:hypothetical protein